MLKKLYSSVLLVLLLLVLLPSSLSGEETQTHEYIYKELELLQNQRLELYEMLNQDLLSLELGLSEAKLELGQVEQSLKRSLELNRITQNYLTEAETSLKREGSKNVINIILFSIGSAIVGATIGATFAYFAE